MAASSVNLSVFSRKSFNLYESSAMLSTEPRSYNVVVKFYRIPLLLSAIVFLTIQSMAGKNKNPDITNPCFTPDLILNKTDILHSSITVHSNPPYMPTITRTILRGIS